ADEAAGPLWYLRAYLWCVVASPLHLKAQRRAPRPVFPPPVALTAVIGTGVVSIPGETGLGRGDVAPVGSGGVGGVADQEGRLRKVPRY
ncbi:acyltransferase family protein, partial [Streptomyces sp. DT18]